MTTTEVSRSAIVLLFRQTRHQRLLLVIQVRLVPCRRCLVIYSGRRARLRDFSSERWHPVRRTSSYCVLAQSLREAMPVVAHVTSEFTLTQFSPRPGRQFCDRTEPIQ
jgi:hypothetical protein